MALGGTYCHDATREARLPTVLHGAEHATQPPVYRTKPTNRLIAGSRASRLSSPARDVCNPMGRALGGGGMTAPPSSCSDHPGLTHVLIRFGCDTLLSPTRCSSHCD